MDINPESTDVGSGRAMAMTLEPELERRVATNAVRARLFGETEAIYVGRYRLERRLGAGGMGEVFLGHDDDLDRKVAIKVLRGPGQPAGRVRMLREAQALARLSHPNIVQIYEVGVHGQHPFLAMEFVDGQTLRQWNDAFPAPGIPQRKCLEVLIDAAQGLSAAHAKGLVHRDFKPENVMIDHGGRVRVMDFGLVHAERNAATSPAQDDLGTDAEALTVTGALMGTPAYMAPEQFEGGATDARTDQFCLCVVAWELLTGVRPHAGQTIAALREAVLAERRCNDGRVMPPWLRRVLERGLAVRPEDRWASIDALVDALRDDPTRRRRRRVGAAMAMGLGVAVTFGAQLRMQALEQAERERATAACRSDAAQIDELWNPRVRARLERVFAANELPHAADAWTRIRAKFDDTARRWADTRAAVCLETELEHTRSETSLSQTRACLDASLTQLRAYIDALAEPEGNDPSYAIEAVSKLEPPEVCLDERRVRLQVLANDSPDAARVSSSKAALERVHALRELARFDAAGRELDAVARTATQLDWLPFVAEVDHATGLLQFARGDYAGAERAFTRGFDGALGSGHDELALRCATELAWTIGFATRDRSGGKRWLSTARALHSRLGLEHGPHEAALLMIAGMVELDQPEALERLERAEQLWTAELGPAHPRVAEVLKYQSRVHARGGRLPEAIALLQRAIDVQEAALGPEHPHVARTLNHLANTQRLMRDFDGAEGSLARAEAIQMRALGPEHPELVETLWSRARVSRSRGALDEALARMLEVERLTTKLEGVDSLTHAEVLQTLGSVRVERHEYDEALACFERIEAISAAQEGPAPRGGALVWQARTLVLRGDTELGRARFEQALMLGEATDDDGLIALSLAGLGELAARVDPEAARTMLERALGLAGQLWVQERATIRFALARVSAEPERARELARTAREELLVGDPPPELLEQIEAFLSSGVDTSASSSTSLLSATDGKETP